MTEQIVTEHRGYGIDYCVFSGSIEECEDWLKTNTHEDANGFNISNDDEDINGNGEPFTYEMCKPLTGW